MESDWLVLCVARKSYLESRKLTRPSRGRITGRLGSIHELPSSIKSKPSLDQISTEQTNPKDIPKSGDLGECLTHYHLEAINTTRCENGYIARETRSNSSLILNHGAFFVGWVVENSY